MRPPQLDCVLRIDRSDFTRLHRWNWITFQSAIIYSGTHLVAKSNKFNNNQPGLGENSPIPAIPSKSLVESLLVECCAISVTDNDNSMAAFTK
ncbi:unnamed protein product, partial [Heterotrigona itama]